MKMYHQKKKKKKNRSYFARKKEKSSTNKPEVCNHQHLKSHSDRCLTDPKVLFNLLEKTICIHFSVTIMITDNKLLVFFGINKTHT